MEEEDEEFLDADEIAKQFLRSNNAELLQEKDLPQYFLNQNDAIVYAQASTNLKKWTEWGEREKDEPFEHYLRRIMFLRQLSWNRLAEQQQNLSVPCFKPYSAHELKQCPILDFHYRIAHGLLFLKLYFFFDLLINDCVACFLYFQEYVRFVELGNQIVDYVRIDELLQVMLPMYPSLKDDLFLSLCFSFFEDVRYKNCFGFETENVEICFEFLSYPSFQPSFKLPFPYLDQQFCQLLQHHHSSKFSMQEFASLLQESLLNLLFCKAVIAALRKFPLCFALVYQKESFHPLLIYNRNIDESSLPLWQNCFSTEISLTNYLQKMKKQINTNGSAKRKREEKEEAVSKPTPPPVAKKQPGVTYLKIQMSSIEEYQKEIILNALRFIKEKISTGFKMTLQELVNKIALTLPEIRTKQRIQSLHRILEHHTAFSFLQCDSSKQTIQLEKLNDTNWKELIKELPSKFDQFLIQETIAYLQKEQVCSEEELGDVLDFKVLEQEIIFLLNAIPQNTIKIAMEKPFANMKQATQMVTLLQSKLDPSKVDLECTNSGTTPIISYLQE